MKMKGMKLAGWGKALRVITLAAMGVATAAATALQQPAPGTPAQAAPKATGSGLKLQSLDPSTVPDPFPQVSAANFTAKSPTVATVDAFLTALWGYDANRQWRVFAIQTTPAQGVSRVTVLVAEKGVNAKVQPTSFFVLPDGKHAIAGDGVVDFGDKPFERVREILQARADGPYRGSAAKGLELVEFADMQCPHCKEAQPMIDRLVQDFPNARVVYQNFPLTQIHPFALQAAENGVCVAKQKPSAFWSYLQSVYDTQGGLTAEDGDTTLKNAVVKAGTDPGPVALCAATPETKAAVESSIKLGTEIGVDQTPMLAINGHLIPVGPAAISYETLKKLVEFQAAQDGVK